MRYTTNLAIERRTSYFGEIRVVYNDNGIVMEVSYFGEGFSRESNSRLYVNQAYIRTYNNTVRFKSDNHNRMESSHIKQLCNEYNLTDNEKNRVLKHIETYYVSRKIGDAYLEFFAIIQSREIEKAYKNMFLNDPAIRTQIIKEYFESELAVKNNQPKKVNKI